MWAGAPVGIGKLLMGVVVLRAVSGTQMQCTADNLWRRGHHMSLVASAGCEVQHYTKIAKIRI
jgi:hypothetical protein